MAAATIIGVVVLHSPVPAHLVSPDITPRPAVRAAAAVRSTVTSTTVATSTSTVTPAPAAASTTTAPTTSSSLSPDPLPPGANLVGQTTAKPSATTDIFQSEMAALWQAIQSNNPTIGLASFFPESAYLQIKALSNDATDYTGRLVAHFDLDIAAAHLLLGAGAVQAQLVKVLVPSSQAAWIPPGSCSNKVGYWHVPGARLVYQEDGIERSMGIASMISWRGYWYVIHLGSVTPPADQGVVDAPAVGDGVTTPQGGC